MKKTVYRPFLPAMVNETEEWLTRMSAQGLELVYMNRWKFVFELSNKNKENEYFVYSGFDASKGFSYEFYRAKEKYAKKSELKKANCSAFSVDPKKRDDEFEIYRNLRDKYYKRHYLLLLLITLIFGVLSLIASMDDPDFICVPCLLCIAVLYSIVSLCILCKKRRK